MDVRGYGPVVLPAGVTPKAKHGPRKGVTARYRPSSVGRESQGLGGLFASSGRKEHAQIDAIAARVRKGTLSYEEALVRVRKVCERT